MIHPLHYGAKAAIPKFLVIFFHGFGANGDNLLDLSYFLETTLPEAVFVSPNGLTPMPHYPGGYQWFPLKDDLNPDDLKQECARVLDKGITLVETIQQHYNVPPERTFFVGFSQGTMMSLAIALAHKNICGGVIGCAGGLYMDASLIKAPKDLPLYLIHGEDDAVVDPSASEATLEFLEGLGFSPTLTLVPRLGHSIDERVLKEIGTTLNQISKGKKYA